MQIEDSIRMKIIVYIFIYAFRLFGHRVVAYGSAVQVGAHSILGSSFLVEISWEIEILSNLKNILRSEQKFTIWSFAPNKNIRKIRFFFSKKSHDGLAM